LLSPTPDHRFKSRTPSESNGPFIICSNSSRARLTSPTQQKVSKEDSGHSIRGRETDRLFKVFSRLSHAHPANAAACVAAARAHEAAPRRDKRDSIAMARLNARLGIEGMTNRSHRPFSFAPTVPDHASQKWPSTRFSSNAGRFSGVLNAALMKRSGFLLLLLSKKEKGATKSPSYFIRIRLNLLKEFQRNRKRLERSARPA